MEIYLDGKIKVSSLAAPTEADRASSAALTKEERQQLINEALERGRNSGVSTRTMDEIWESAKAKARVTTPENAL